MSEQLTPSLVASNLAKLARQLDDLVAAIDDAEVRAVNAREDYTMAYARAFLTSEGSMDVRRQLATEGTHDTRLAAELAEQLVKGIRRQIDSTRIRIDGIGYEEWARLQECVDCAFVYGRGLLVWVAS
jgi:hypothetical protein